MFDGFSIQRLYVSFGELLSLDFKEFHDNLHISTVDFIKKYGLKVDYKNLKLVIKAEAHQCSNLDVKVTSRLTGSVHKFSNEGIHNYNDFSIDDLSRVLDRFVFNIGIDPFKSQLTSLEFGVNIQLPFQAKKLLDSLLLYKNKAFSREPKDGDLLYRQCELSEYKVKIYAKQNFEGNPGNLSEGEGLRFEVKVKDMTFLEKNGIKIRCLADLLNMRFHPLLCTLLLKIGQQILFDDLDLDSSRLSYKECKRLVKEKNVIRTIGSRVDEGRRKTKEKNPDGQVLRGDRAKLSNEETTQLKRKKDAQRKREHRAKKYIQFIQDKYPPLFDLQEVLLGLIKCKWEQLTKTDDLLVEKIGRTLGTWRKRDYSCHSDSIYWTKLQYLANMTNDLH